MVEFKKGDTVFVELEQLNLSETGKQFLKDQNIKTFTVLRLGISPDIVRILLPKEAGGYLMGKDDLPGWEVRTEKLKKINPVTINVCIGDKVKLLSKKFLPPKHENFNVDDEFFTVKNVVGNEDRFQLLISSPTVDSFWVESNMCSLYEAEKQKTSSKVFEPIKVGDLVCLFNETTPRKVLEINYDGNPGMVLLEHDSGYLRKGYDFPTYTASLEHIKPATAERIESVTRKNERPMKVKINSSGQKIDVINQNIQEGACLNVIDYKSIKNICKIADLSFDCQLVEWPHEKIVTPHYPMVGL